MMRFSSLVLCAILAAAMGPAAAGAVPPELPPATPVRLRLEMDLRSGRDKIGEPVLFTVAENIYTASHTLLLGKGSVARGHVTQSSGRGAFRRGGKLSFTCDYAIAPGGVHVPLILVVDVEPFSRPEDSSVGEIGAEVSVGQFSDGSGHSASPGGDYHEAGVTAGIAVDAGQLLGTGSDETAERGQEYEATLPPTPALASPAASVGQLSAAKDKMPTVSPSTPLSPH